MTLWLLLASLVLAQEAPEDTPEEPLTQEAPPEPERGGMGLSADDAIEIGDEMRTHGAGYAALIAYTEAVADDPKKAGTRLEAMLYLAGHTGDEPLLAHAMRRYGVPETDNNDHRSQAKVLAARAHLQRGEYEKGLALVKTVNPKSAGHADAEALRGVFLNQIGKPRQAIAAFLTAQGAGRATDRGDLFDDGMDLNTARTYYAAKGFAKSIEFYALVDHESPWWPQATFERAWAHFMLDDVAGTLALLMNLNSPFLEDWFFPEGDMLRAQSFFLMCKFPDAAKEIERFETRYLPMKEQLDRTLPKMDAAAAFAEVAAFRDGEPTKIPGPILRSFTYDKRFQDAEKAVDHAQSEMSRLATESIGEAGDLALALLEERRQEVIQIEGARVLARARWAKTLLADQIQNNQITKLDIMAFEQKLYERAAVTGTLESGDKIGQLRKEARRKGYRYWPYQGEYWADEIGHFRISARPDCPEELAVGGASGR